MPERAVSLLGLLVIVGIAWVFSRHRRRIRMRTVLWGTGLQFLLAVIILSEGTRSFVGMFVLAFLIVLYLTEETVRGWGHPIAVGAASLAGSVGLVVLFHRLHATGATEVLLALALVGAAVATRMRRPALVRLALVLFLLLGLATLWARGVDGRTVFAVLSAKVAGFLALSNEGARFLFGNLAVDRYFGPQETWPGFGFQFAFSVLPTIIFFSAFMSILYHLGIIQRVIEGMARFMSWTLQTSGSETVSCSANVFVGQTEAPFLVKPFLPEMTASELHAVMVGGFATIAGGVLAGYIQMGVNPGHLIAASVMSAPAALVIAKVLLPETEESATAGEVVVPRVQTAPNVVGAAANGVTDGLALGLNVAAMLVGFIALIAMIDVAFGFVDHWLDGVWFEGALDPANGEFRGIFPGSLATLFGTLLSPLAWVMGVPWVDAKTVGNLLGVKLSVNEFVAYGLLSKHIAAGDMSERSVIIATYALCGFANFSSVGIQIGGISALAPERRDDLARIGLRAMFGGALASWMTATIAGMLL